MRSAIAIVGMACRYADARNPQELWENVLARRRAFRRMPEERLRLGDYFAEDPEVADAIYTTQAALITDYDFDRVRFRVAGPIFRSVDMTHWLALDVAGQALEDAGFLDREAASSLPRETTGVLVGNTLTGEFSRAAALRLRWPYTRRVVDARLRAEGWDEQHRAKFLHDIELDYKAPFAPVGEETLAGALSNTIAGRICNHFHLGGGGYALDGACCSSLLAVARACSALEAGEVDVALAGGVDLSLDPFELVGFAKAGALARGEMLVYDRDSSGFLPGEGCGFVALMRAEDARDRGLRSYGVIRGWGISSDGGGSITRPEVEGQALALRRAYQRAGYAPGQVGLFEGHGTGTPVGDAVELQALAMVRGQGRARTLAAVGSVKTNIGHTKAAAGIAGLIKAALALHHRLLPPMTGTRRPRPELEGKEAAFRVLESAEPWPEALPLRAGVNSFGFGGINVHVTLEGVPDSPASTTDWRSLASGAQDTEIFLLSADSRSALAGKIEALGARAAGFSYAELTDVSCSLAEQAGSGTWRAAVVASSPRELGDQLAALHGLLDRGITRRCDPDQGIFLGVVSATPRIGLAFPGQGSPVRLHGGAHARRFASARDVYRLADLHAHADPESTATAQIAIAAAEAAGLRLLNDLGIQASVAIGHSLGELAAYCWAGAMDEAVWLELVRTRGRCMAEIPGPAGAMAGIAAGAAQVAALLAEDPKEAEAVAIACLNAPGQVVVAGGGGAVARVVERARARGWNATLLPTAHAFHSSWMRPAAGAFQQAMRAIELRPLRRRVLSTITGAELPEDACLRTLLVKQLTAPVRFAEALEEAAQNTDLLLEVGPGHILTRLAAAGCATPAIALDVAGPSLNGVLQAAAAAYVLGAPLRTEALFRDRFRRPFNLDHRPSFFVNPCELAPPAAELERASVAPPAATGNGYHRKRSAIPCLPDVDSDKPLEVLRALIALRTELPPASIPEDAHLLRDLHLNSIVVGELVSAAARRLGMAPPRQVLEFADATVVAAARALEYMRASARLGGDDAETALTGVDDWQRAFVLDWVPRSLRRRTVVPPAGAWRVFAPPASGLAASLSAAGLPGSGVIVCLASESLHEQADMLLHAAHAALENRGERRSFVVLGVAGPSAAFARTLHLEDPDIATRVIAFPPDSADDFVLQRVVDEISAAGDCVDARYDGVGERRQALLRMVDENRLPETAIPLGSGDVVLVTGGGKGIVAECSLLLARETGAALAILGRSRAEDDASVGAHLKRLDAAGIRAKYFSADVTDAAVVRATVAAAEEALGRVTAIVHGAGRNQPSLLRDLEHDALRRTMAPKVQGLRNLLAATDAAGLRLLVTFGSVIGRAGLRGEADYALANAFQSFLTEEFARQHPACRCLAFESSAWSGIGMAERLGSIEGLRREGIAAISPDRGVAWFRNLVKRDWPAVSIMLTGRLGPQPPLPCEGELPLARFLEKPRVYYPGIELVADSELTTASDPYLLDHVFQDQPLLPGVMALEAMTQAAMAVTGETRLPLLTDVRFERPVAVAPGERVTLRLAALVREAGRVEVVARCSSTSFQVNHFRCLCSFTDPPLSSAQTTPPAGSPRLGVEPEADLYGKLLFQSGRFRRLAGYRFLNARACWAEVAAAGKMTAGKMNGDESSASKTGWFSQYLPASLALGDAAARDAALHAVQACVPHAVLLPVGVKRLYAAPLNTPADEELLVHATRRRVEGSNYFYDVDLHTADGVLRERWEELELRKVADAPNRSWPDPLVAVFLEWRVAETIATAGVAAAFDRDHGGDRRSRSERAIRRALESPHPLRWRADGKPEVEAGAVAVSAAHANGLTLAVAGPHPVACDLEPVRARSVQVWRDLLGRERWSLAELIANEAGEDLQTAATRVWTALESLKKADAPEDAPLVLLSCTQEKPGCVSLAASGLKIATSIVQFRDDPTEFAVSVLAGSNA